ncbi:WD40-repeat-containing domain [Pseudocohnilembus persalinus]|uniref:WD40-repeat-containing domain n=1 Tax=Pseudocohnilembus persalinus TaxID=266149 RepID=A0A0V0QCS3_PSEPJ|nr:WD40-repeat-containing domain [Pseudocohnilembus persalinus]|eukprot:KRX00017.1 WD40-repeat-containing domain [Pseudocohnilembus persalinus]
MDKLLCPLHKLQSQKFCTSLFCNKETTRIICEKCLQQDGQHYEHEFIGYDELQKFIENDSHEEAVFDILQIKNNLVSIAGDNQIKLWGLEQQKCLDTYKSKERAFFFCMCYTKQGFAVGDSDGNITGFSYQESLENPFKFMQKGHIDQIVCIQSYCQISLQEEKLFTGGENGLIKVWNYYTEECINQLNFSDLDLGLMMINNDRLYALGQAGNLQSWNFKKNYMTKKHQIQISDQDYQNKQDSYDENQVSSFWVLDESNIIFTTFKDIYVFNIQQEKITSYEKNIHQLQIFSVKQVCKNIYATSSQDEIVKLWKIDTAEINQNQIKLFKILKGGHTDGIKNIIRIKNSNLFATAGADEKIVIWN